MWLTRLALQRPVLIWMTFAALVVLGLQAWINLPTELNPRVDLPSLTVMTVYPGAGPQEVEARVTHPIEDAVATVGGVRNVFSSSQEGVSFVVATFPVGTDLDRVTADVREQVDLARRDLPEEAHSPIVYKLDINAQPVLVIGFYGDLPPWELRSLADETVKYRISQVPGVGDVRVIGGEKKEIRVEVDPGKLEVYHLSLSDVIEPLRAASLNVPAGRITQGTTQWGVRISTEFRSLEQIREAPIPVPPVSQRSTLRMITLGDIAEVRETVAPPEEITRVNGKDSVVLLVTKASEANTVAVVDGVKRVLKHLTSLLPKGCHFVISQDQSILVREALADVNMSLWLGAFMAVTIVFLFLQNLKGTLIVSLAIPTCIISTFLVMYFVGFTLNQMTMLALSLSVGILVDDSILILESIYRHMAQGETPREASWNGRSEIGLADTTNTLVDVVVFVPIAFMGGIIGQFFRSFGLTVATATLLSLAVSFSLTPMLAARWYRYGEPLELKGRFFDLFNTFYRRLDRQYREVLYWALHHRPLVIIVGFGSLALSFTLAWAGLGIEFLPQVDQGQVSIAVQLPPGSSLSATDAVVRQVEREVSKIPEVEAIFSEVGRISGGFGALPEQGEEFGQVALRLIPKESLLERFLGLHPRRKRSDSEIAEEVRKRLRNHTGAHFIVSVVRGLGTGGAPIEVVLRSQDLNALSKAAQRVRQEMMKIPGVLDPDISLRVGAPEIEVQVQREKASAFGLLPGQIAKVLRSALHGETPAKFRDKGRELEVRVVVAGINQQDPSALSALPIATVMNPSSGAVTPLRLGEIAEISWGQGPIRIDRYNRIRQVVVTANLARGYPLGNVQAQIDQRLRNLGLEGISISWGGEAEELSENIPAVLNALFLAALLSYMLMAALFNSFLHPFTIILSLPMALVGAIVALVLAGETISLVAMIGIIMLTGLVAKNAILLVDYTNTLKARGYPRREALLLAGPTRLRPILMTTLSTVFGMLPVALRIGRASEIRAPMAIAVIGGLLLSTLLTLVVIPVVYSLFDEWLESRKKKEVEIPKGLDSRS